MIQEKEWGEKRKHRTVCPNVIRSGNAGLYYKGCDKVTFRKYHEDKIKLIQINGREILFSEYVTDRIDKGKTSRCGTFELSKGL